MPKSRENFLSPVSPLNPETALDALSRPVIDDLQRMKLAGYGRYGIVAAVMCEDRLMMLRHTASDKIEGNEWGPLAETSKMTLFEDGSPDYIESTAETLSRAMHEEVGVDAEHLQLTTRAIGAWALHDWPIGKNYGKQRAFATCPIVHLDTMQGKAIERDFQPTDEIDDIAFLAPHEIIKLRQQRAFRAGTKSWLRKVVSSDLRESSSFMPLHLARATAPDNAVDIDFSNPKIKL